ncbi:DUF935 domain-containing protein [Mesorhizobium sp. ES1-1]|uniref:DUF935 domain-containing protein n=1 Tax=Mesorhizobium sp. ES1-1 TaxID=2876629 RepID=UPI0021E213BF|nr:DUF935 domain-containing protein [Mesorhizobium sp. ES1-1]
MHPAAGLTPGRLARILRDSIDGDPEQYLALAEDIEERDPHYASVLATRKLQVAGLEIKVEAAGEDAAAVQHADLVREVTARDAFQIELRDMLDAIGKGFSATEILWDTSESQWRPKQLKWRDPRWFTFDTVDADTLLLGEPGGAVPLKPFGWIAHYAKAKSGLPIRGGLARGAAWGFLFKSFTVKDWAIFCEAYGQPLRLGKYDAGATERDKAVLLEAVTNIGTDYAAIVPTSMTVDFVGATISGNHELYERRADWLDRQTSKLVLGQTATTDAIAGGHAVGKTHDRVRVDIEEADAIQLAATLNRDLSKPLVDLNFGPQKKYPTITIGRPEEIDLDKFMERLKTFVELGGKVASSVVRDKLGLPDPGAEEELLAAPARPAQGNKAPGNENDDEESARAAPFSTGARKDDAVDQAAEEIARDWRPLIEPIVAGLSDAIAAAASIEDVKQLLADRFAGLDVSALTEELARAAFAARISGEAGETI